MQITVNGTTLWFDVDGPSFVPNGDGMRSRPTVFLVHGGPGSYDHSYFKPDFGRLTRVAQVVYLDLRDHGRSGRGDADAWTFEQSADDIRAFCDALGIDRPIVFGHSMGGWVVALYAARHPEHPAGIILQSTMARYDPGRLVESFRRNGGDDVAELARRSYAGENVTDAEWARVLAAFGPVVPKDEALRRRVQNLDVAQVGMDLFRRLDIRHALPHITATTLVCVGELDGPTPVAASEEIVAALRPGVGRLAVLPGLGHFPWLDDPDAYWPVIKDFVVDVAPSSDGD